jgi:poly-gamma-glutamate synthesis protein (capsule biosynthesis protein)
LNIFRSFPLKSRAFLLLALLVVINAGFLPGWVRGEPELPSARQQSGPPEKFLESFFRHKEVYTEAFAKVQDLKKTKIAGGIVCHHFLARDLLAEFFAGIDATEVKRVILVGPDHFKIDAPQHRAFFTSARPWRTPFGLVEADAEFIQALIDAEGAVLNDRIFMREHSIYILVPFIKKALPEARIVPLILPNGTDYGKFRQFGQRLRQLSPPGTIMIVSSDFAHGVNQTTARRQDEQSLGALKNLQEKNISRITCDCRPGVATLLGFLGNQKHKLVVLKNKTSLDFGSDTPHNLTSYLTAYYLKEEAAPITLLFLGDLMFDRGIRKIAAARGNDYIFKKMRGYLWKNDLVIANLEGPITAQPSVSVSSRRGEKNHCVFTFPASLPETLKKHNITLVNLGNNHLRDFGREGLEQTRKYLSAAKISYFGHPEGEEHRWVIKNIAGVRIGLVNYNQFNQRGVEDTLEDMAQVRKRADLVIIYAHWGSDADRHPGDRTRRLAQKFIDHGADLIIGSHPHMVQEKEEYRGKMVYYSLGNFVFDQYLKNDTCQGLGVRVRINPAPLQVELTEVPLLLEKNGQTSLKGNFP